ncbi:MAG: bifunctional pyr operon transcriptional regulator/uracil phosphoribosyltransferase PyrR [Chitinophagales bacterium]
MKPRIILDTTQLNLVINRLCYQLIEDQRNFSETVIIGVQPRGIFLAQRIFRRLKELENKQCAHFGKLDITFHRDDFGSDKILTPNETDLDFSIENKRVVLIDDVLYSGRTIRAALDALLSFGRPKDVELMVLIDRKLHRDLPIKAKYVGKTIDSIVDERVKVEWESEDGKDQVWILPLKAETKNK